MNDDVRSTAHSARRSQPVIWGARAGYAASGVLHLLLGWLAGQVALGDGARSADQSGALALIADESWGKAVLAALAGGFLLLALWQVTVLLTGRELGERAKAAGKCLVYVAVGWTALRFVFGERSSSGKQTRDFTVSLLDSGWGRLLIGAIGLGVVAVGVYHVVKGWRRGFLEDLQEHPGAWAVHAGRIGYIAKGLALMTVGVLFAVAALRDSSARATGLDGALRALRDLPFGPVVLLVVALGLATYGVYSFARARYTRT